MVNRKRPDSRSKGLGDMEMKTVARQQSTTNIAAKVAITDKAVKVLAGSIYRQLQDEGYAAKDIISVSSQLIDLVTTELKKDDSAPNS